MKRNTCFLIFCMILVGNAAFCQFSRITSKQKDPPTAINFRENYAGLKFNSTILPGNFYTRHLGYFCQQELKFESATGIPFRFRLGSVSYTDWLEGKKNISAIANY